MRVSDSTSFDSLLLFLRRTDGAAEPERTPNQTESTRARFRLESEVLRTFYRRGPVDIVVGGTHTPLLNTTVTTPRSRPCTRRDQRINLVKIASVAAHRVASSEAGESVMTTVQAPCVNRIRIRKPLRPQAPESNSGVSAGYGGANAPTKPQPMWFPGLNPSPSAS